MTSARCEASQKWEGARDQALPRRDFTPQATRNPNAHLVDRRDQNVPAVPIAFAMAQDGDYGMLLYDTPSYDVTDSVFRQVVTASRRRGHLLYLHTPRGSSEYATYSSLLRPTRNPIYKTDTIHHRRLWLDKPSRWVPSTSWT